MDWLPDIVKAGASVVAFRRQIWLRRQYFHVKKCLLAFR